MVTHNCRHYSCALSGEYIRVMAKINLLSDVSSGGCGSSGVAG
jgi:hypothetical protein